jgi:hypothetical protein
MPHDPSTARLLDPRGELVLARPALARRPDASALSAGTLLFYDNTKLDVGQFGLLLPTLKEGLAARGITRFVDERLTIRGTSGNDLDAMSRRFQALGVCAAVIALADMGVSPAMVALTVAMERLGIATVCLTAGPGSRLARAHAHYRAGQLCLLPYDIHPGTPASTIRQLAQDSVGRLLDMLTAQGPELQTLAAVDHDVDALPAQADGLLPHDPQDLSASGELDLDAVHNRFERLHLGDALPFVPPTPARYEAMRAYCPFDPGEVILRDIGPSGTPLRVREALIAAVMAGCRPNMVPILLTALRAIATPAYGLRQAITTSFSGGHFVLVSGPIAQQVGVHGGQGCLGPGFRANAAIGRAVNLALINVCRSVPGKADLACLSSPAETGYCMAEDPTLSPWPTMNQERFDAGATCVMTLKAEPPHALMDFASDNAQSLMGTIRDACTTLASNNAYVPGCLVLVLTPDHASLLADAGYDKARLRREIHESVKTPIALLKGRGIVGLSFTDDGDGCQRVTRTPDDVAVVVAGGKGGHSAVILPWSLHADPIHELVRLPDGQAARDIEAFRRA